MELTKKQIKKIDASKIAVLDDGTTLAEILWFHGIIKIKQEHPRIKYTCQTACNSTTSKSDSAPSR